MIIPLIAHDQAIGVLFLLAYQAAGAFGVEAHATLEGLANLTAAAILEERSAREAATLSRQLPTWRSSSAAWPSA